MTSRISSRSLIAVAAFAVASPGLAFGQCQSSKTANSNQHHDEPMMATFASNVEMKQRPSIIDIASASDDFSTLTAAIKAAGLVDALSGPGPFTVFAPTDEAFAQLPKGTLDHLLKPENRKALQDILKYHVVSGDLMAKSVVRTAGTSTLNGQRIEFRSGDDGVFVNDAQVVTTDIQASNGVIHVIDSVILPSTLNIADTAAKAGMFNTLLTAVTEAGLAEALSTDGPFTVLAPTDDAFAKLPAGTVESLLKPENKDQLIAILKYHVIPGRVSAANAAAKGEAGTLQGSKVNFNIRDGRMMVNGANLIKTDINAANGTIHVIDQVILP